ncbi:MAG: hypothetical protein AAB316_01485, partial [Bacteroidota bacterium]
QTELLQLLAVFDQKNAENNHHILNLLEENIPEKYRPIIRRLQKAIAEKKVRDTMTAEDDILEDFQMMERLVADRDKTIEEKDKALEENAKMLEAKDQALEAKDQEIERLKKLLEK